MIPKSGGDYAYIGEAFGDLPAFLYLWVALFILVPTGNAITALTFAQNILKPLWPACEPPTDAVSLIAAVVTCKYKQYFFYLHAFLAFDLLPFIDTKLRFFRSNLFQDLSKETSIMICNTYMLYILNTLIEI